MDAKRDGLAYRKGECHARRREAKFPVHCWFCHKKIDPRVAEDSHGLDDEADLGLIVMHRCPGLVRGRLSDLVLCGVSGLT